MPQFSEEINETHLRIRRQTVKQIVDDLLKKFKGLPFREFRYAGEAVQLITPGSAIDSTPANRDLGQNHITIEVEDNPDYSMGYTQVPKDGVKPLFRCTKTGLDIYPVYQNRKLVISLIITSSSRVRINNLITQLKQGMVLQSNMLTHKISYDYDIPPVTSVLINHIYNTMENKHGYNIEFIDWLREIVQDKVQLSTRLDGEKGVLTVRENAVNVLSHVVESDEEPRKESDNNGVWEFTLELEARYMRPNMVRCSYPCVVNNQILHELFLPTPIVNHDYRAEQATSHLDIQAMEVWKNNRDFSNWRRSTLGYKDPPFDDWGKEIGNSKLKPLLTTLILLDETDYYQIFNLETDLADFNFSEDFLSVLKIRSDATTFDGQHFITVKFFTDDRAELPEYLVADKVNYRTKYKADPRKFHHFIIYLNIDPTTIPDSVWQDILDAINDKDNPDRTKVGKGVGEYFGTFGEDLKDDWNKLVEDKMKDSEDVTRGDINNIIREIINRNNPEDFDNSAKYIYHSSPKTKLRFHVIGTKG